MLQKNVYPLYVLLKYITDIKCRLFPSTNCDMSAMNVYKIELNSSNFNGYSYRYNEASNGCT